jgi:CubicO group peptidase (beta-lactamase class C family)
MKPTIQLIFYFFFVQTFSQELNLEQTLANYAKEHRFNGVILIQEGEKLIHQKTYGEANKEFQVVTSRDTKYRIASVTKLFTSVLVYQLQEKGKLDIDKTIGEYLPNYKGEGKDKVTLHQLLTSTSGIQALENNGDEVYEKRLSSDEIFEMYASGSVVFEPGSKFNYNNADFIILGRILEELYKKPFDQILNEQILDPLMMENTGMFHYQVVPKLAQCYWYNDETKLEERDPPYYVENYYASGAMYSTADDLLTFANALYGNELLKKETLTKMLKPELEVEDADNYASGLWSYKYQIPGGEYHSGASRQGNIWGAESMILRLFDKDITMIILSNAIGDEGMWSLVWTIKRKLYAK